MLETYLSLTWQSLARQKSRTFFSMLAIAIGIAAVVAIMAAGRGVERFILGQLEVYGPNTLSIEVKVPNGKQGIESDNGSTSGILITTLNDRDIRTIERHPNIAAAYGMVMGQEIASYEGRIKKIFLMGNGADMGEIERYSLEYGRFFTDEEDASLASVVVLGSRARAELFGEDDPIGKTVYLRGRPFRVVGSMAPRGSAFFLDLDNMIILPTRTMQKKLLGIDYVNNIMARIRDRENMESTIEDLAAAIRANHAIDDSAKDDFSIHSMAEAQQVVGSIAGGITFLLTALVCISLVVGGIGIMNIMYVSVAERTFEIGLRKSLGATNQNILWQFLLEAVGITLGGGAVGVVLGASIALGVYYGAIAAGIAWVYSVSVFSILLSVGFSMAIGLIFGLYPAKKAAALSPIQALNRE